LVFLTGILPSQVAKSKGSQQSAVKSQNENRRNWHSA
jgi:hypothetical protein